MFVVPGVNRQTPKIMIVVTHGNGNRGHYSALDAADVARGYGIDVYAVGIGNSVNPSQQKVSLRNVVRWCLFRCRRVRIAGRITINSALSRACLGWISLIRLANSWVAEYAGQGCEQGMPWLDFIDKGRYWLGGRRSKPTNRHSFLLLKTKMRVAPQACYTHI